jgi:hypothetical protein
MRAIISDILWVGSMLAFAAFALGFTYHDFF